LRMAATSPIPKSFLGCGTTTIPGRDGCLKTLCEPRTRSSVQPAFSSSRIRTALFIYTSYTRQEFCSTKTGFCHPSNALWSWSQVRPVFRWFSYHAISWRTFSNKSSSLSTKGSVSNRTLSFKNGEGLTDWHTPSRTNGAMVYEESCLNGSKSPRFCLI